MANLVFDTLTAPEGLAFDTEGNLYLSTLTSILPGIPASDPVIFKIAPDGTLVNQLSLGAISFSGATLEFIPEFNTLTAFTPEGVLVFIDPATLTPTGSINITQLPFDTSAIYDVATDQISNFGGVIQPQFSSFGDLDIRVVDSDTVEFWVTGLSQAQVYPFVARLEFQLGVGFTAADVLLSSNADALSIAPQSPRLSRGIAVNAQGTVMTSLPIAGATQPIDVLVAFPATLDASDGLTQTEVPLVLSTVDAYSHGLTTDAFGNFYIATNSVGSAAFGIPGEGALIGITADISQTFITDAIGLPLSSFRDVAIDPLTGTPFVTVSTFSVGTPADDLLVAFPLAPATAQLTTTSDTVASTARWSPFATTEDFSPESLLVTADFTDATADPVTAQFTQSDVVTSATDPLTML